MKKTIRLLSLLLVALLLACTMTACGGTDVTTATTTTTTSAGGAPQAPTLPTFWDTATYRADAEIGTGATTFYLTVKAEQYGITLTVHTDETNLGAALSALSLISGEQGAYGLYVKTVNGMTLDPDNSNVYWGFFIGEDFAMSGVDSTPITAGATYTLSYASF